MEVLLILRSSDWAFLTALMRISGSMVELKRSLEELGAWNEGIDRSVVEAWDLLG